MSSSFPCPKTETDSVCTNRFVNTPQTEREKRQWNTTRKFLGFLVCCSRLRKLRPFLLGTGTVGKWVMGALKSSMDAGFYSPIKDFRLKFEAEHGVFCFCSWVYFLDSPTFPSTVILLVESVTKSSAPLLVVNEEKRLLLLPMIPKKEVPETPNSAWWNAIPHVLTRDEFPVGKWVHVECQVSDKVLRLHVNGELMEEQPLAIPAETASDSSSPRKVSLVGDGVEGYLYRPMILPPGMSSGDHYKDPPFICLLMNCP